MENASDTDRFASKLNFRTFKFVHPNGEKPKMKLMQIVCKKCNLTKNTGSCKLRHWFVHDDNRYFYFCILKIYLFVSTISGMIGVQKNFSLNYAP